MTPETEAAMLAWVKASPAMQAALRRFADRLTTTMRALGDVFGTVEDYRRHHPQPMPPGVVTWDPRRRRHRRRTR